MGRTKTISGAEPGVLDEAAFADLVSRTHVALRAFIAGIGVSPADVDDLAQETYMVFLRSSPPESVPETAWLRGIARNLCREHFRRLGRRERLRRHALSELLATSETPEDADPRREALSACLERLSPASMRLVELRYVEEQGSEAIAAQVGSTARAVRVALHRIRRRLAECIARRVAREERA